MARWLMGFMMLFVLAGALPTPADAQVVVKVGPQHRRHYRHRRYRHHRPYRR
jgi:hypothetical protein